MKILVTGGGGFLGQALCRGLRERGHEVVSFQRRHSAALEALGVEQRLGDLADAAAVQRAFEGVDAVLHNAAKAGQWPRIERELRALGQTQRHTAGIDQFALHPGFPVDIRHNAKIGREKLAVWAAAKLSR
jgi:nucleoside-diphosphate-sugar epimerase